VIGKKSVLPVGNQFLSMSVVRMKIIDSSKKPKADRMRFMAAASVVRFSLKKKVNRKEER
jgi:hypothetical protein